MRRAIVMLCALGVLSVPRAADAALTDSEQAQIAGFVKAGSPEQAPRIRALVGRADLSIDEASAPLIAGYRESEFDARRAELTRALLFGPGSDAARSTVVQALIPALLARAAQALAAPPSERSAQEVVAIHAFVSQAIANAGKPPHDGHDPSAGIRDDALRAAALAYKLHIEQHPKQLRHGSPVDGRLVAVRAQTQLTALALGRGLFAKHELSAWLGLDGARRGAFERRGVLVEDGGSASEARLDLAVRMLEASPRAAQSCDLFLIHKTPGRGLSARRKILRARASLGAQPLPVDAARLWPEEIEPARPDAELAEIAYAIAWRATRVAFEANPELEKVATRLAADAAGAGRDAYLAADLIDGRLGPSGMPEAAVGASPELFAAHSLRLVLMDASRAATLAVVRARAGRTEPAAQLALALGVLAHGTDQPPTRLGVGRSAKDGGVELRTAGDLKLSGALVTSFTLDADRFELGISPDGRVGKLLVNGAEPKQSKLPLVRLVPAAGEAWTAAGVEWTRLTGAPRGLSVDDGRFVLGAAKQSSGFDAVVAGRDAVDASLSATLRPIGAGGGLLVRAQAGDSSYDAIALLLSAEPPRAQLVLVDGKGRAIELAPAIELGPPKADGWAATLSVKKQAVTATVGEKKLEAKLARAEGSGRIGLTVRPGGRLEVKRPAGPTLAAAPKQK
jgi:hypothetical protein